MTYLLAQLIAAGTFAGLFTLSTRRRRKDRADMAEAESFIAALRGES